MSDRPPVPLSGPLGVLQRIRASVPSQAQAVERCEMCAEPVAAKHDHVVHLETRSMLCTCRPCALLFAYDGDGLTYRTVPDRYLNFPRFRLTRAQWDDLAIPVGLVFFFRNSRQERTVACYPGPAGAAESELPLGAWDAILADNSELAQAAPDVEAIVVRAREEGFDCFLVPIDACYELVGRLRAHWRGFDGGQEARQELEEFFSTAQSRSRPSRDREAVSNEAVGSEAVGNEVSER